MNIERLTQILVLDGAMLASFTQLSNLVTVSFKVARATISLLVIVLDIRQDLRVLLREN